MRGVFRVNVANCIKERGDFGSEEVLVSQGGLGIRWYKGGSRQSLPTGKTKMELAMRWGLVVMTLTVAATRVASVFRWGDKSTPGRHNNVIIVQNEPWRILFALCWVSRVTRSSLANHISRTTGN